MRAIFPERVSEWDDKTDPSIWTAEAFDEEAFESHLLHARESAPPALGARIDEVEPHEAPYEPPPGALRAPVAPPVWRSEGDGTARLVPADEAPAPLPRTAELAVPPTREHVGAAREHSEITYILNEAQMRGEEPVPLNPNRAAHTPVEPLSEENTRVDGGRSLHEEKTLILDVGDERDDVTQTISTESESTEPNE